MAPEERIGEVLLGKLEILRVLGGGGMGVVYEVEHRLTGHRRALKLVHAKYAGRPRFMKRLLREAKVAGKLQTPYVVETYDAGRLEDGSAYVLMELLNGRSLYQAMQEDGPFEPRRLARIMVQVAEGMAVAHEAGIVHRDLKPENVFVTVDEEGEERVKILDFGVSKFAITPEEPAGRLTVEGTLVGTPYYMSPEQAAGREVDGRTDVYAMGVMMYEALAGRLPFEAETVGALLVKIGAGECVPLSTRRPDLDPAFARLVHRAFARDLEERFPTAEALRRELLAFIGGGTLGARARTISDGAPPPPALEPLPAPPRLPDDESGPHAQAQSAPPAPAAARSPIPGWTWAVAGAIAVALVLIPWVLSQRETADLAVRPTLANAADATPRAGAMPMVPVSPDAGVLVVAPPPPETEPGVEPPIARPETGPRPPRPRGLDPNPYRR